MATLDTGSYLNDDLNSSILIGGKILCLSNINGDFDKLESMIQKTEAVAVFHTGAFGFLTEQSIFGLSERVLRHLIETSTLIQPDRRAILKAYPSLMLKRELKIEELSQFPLYLRGEKQFSVPIYTIHGSCDDVQVLCSLTSSHNVINLHFIDQLYSPTIEIGELKLRVFGLGGVFARTKLFDHGSGSGSLAGNEDGAWVTLLQIGELVKMIREIESPSEVKILLTHTNPSKDPILAQLASSLKADYHLSPGFKFPYCQAYNQLSVHPNADNYSHEIVRSKEEFLQLWNAVRHVYEEDLQSFQTKLLQNAIWVLDQIPAFIDQDFTSEQFYVKDSWHFTLPDPSVGQMVLKVLGGTIGTDMQNYGANFSHRSSKSIPTKQSESTQNISFNPASHKYDGRITKPGHSILSQAVGYNETKSPKPKKQPNHSNRSESNGPEQVHITKPKAYKNGYLDNQKSESMLQSRPLSPSKKERTDQASENAPSSIKTKPGKKGNKKLNGDSPLLKKHSEIETIDKKLVNKGFPRVSDLHDDHRSELKLPPNSSEKIGSSRSDNSVKGRKIKYSEVLPPRPVSTQLDALRPAVDDSFDTLLAQNNIETGWGSDPGVEKGDELASEVNGEEQLENDSSKGWEDVPKRSGISQNNGMRGADKGWKKPYDKEWVNGGTSWKNNKTKNSIEPTSTGWGSNGRPEWGEDVLSRRGRGLNPKSPSEIWQSKKKEFEGTTYTVQDWIRKAKFSEPEPVGDIIYEPSSIPVSESKAGQFPEVLYLGPFEAHGRDHIIPNEVALHISAGGPITPDQQFFDLFGDLISHVKKLVVFEGKNFAFAEADSPGMMSPLSTTLSGKRYNGKYIRACSKEARPKGRGYEFNNYRRGGGFKYNPNRFPKPRSDAGSNSQSTSLPRTS